MRKIILTGYLIFIVGCVFGQKPLIDSNTFGKWPEIQRGPQLSADGNYAMYLESQPADGSNVLHIVNTGTQKEITQTGINTFGFSNDGKKAIYLTNRDILNIITLKTHIFNVIEGVQSFKIAPNGNWMALQSKGSSGNLTILNMITGRSLSLSSTTSYEFNSQGDALVVYGSSLVWLDLTTGKNIKIFESKGIRRGKFDNSGTQFAFYAQTTFADGTAANALYLYKKGWEKAKIVAHDQSSGLKGFVLADELPLFSTKNDKLLVSLDKVDLKVKAASGYSGVSILNSSDPYIDDDKGAEEVKYKAVVSVTTGDAWCINPDGAQLQLNNFTRNFENFVLLNPNPNREFKWWMLGGDTFEIADLSKKRVISLHIPNSSREGGISNVEFGPNENFLLWFNGDSSAYYSYETATGNIRNISKVIPQAMGIYLAKDGRAVGSWGIVGYAPDGQSIYLYDQYDIWKANLRGQDQPVNITHGFGRRNSITLSQLFQNGDHFIDKANCPMMLGAYNYITKQNGFFKLSMFAKDPLKACLDDYKYCVPRTGVADIYLWGEHGMVPIKAKDAEVYLLKRQTDTGYPNLYVTHDFAHFKSISDLHPEKRYNWLTAELLNWKDRYGELNQGILYKPENFDPNKKYPVIFSYYIHRSDELHDYKEPDWTLANINIPYFVSNGYLVFVPDLHYYLHPNDGEITSIVSGASYISKLPYVDSTKMGITGHSLGGYETNMIVTRTQNIFAAACSVDGLSDMFSADGVSSRSDVSISMHTVKPFWSDPSLYIDHSAIFGVDRATTPLMLVHCVYDPVCPYEQAVEFYHALRRADKKCWFLTYPRKQWNSNHWPDGEDAKDFTLRIKQFFDYYLKDAPPPVWMTSTSVDGRTPITTSLELDKSGKQP